MLIRTCTLAALLAVATVPALAQTTQSDTDRRAALAGPLSEQRNAAQNSLALCLVDSAFVMKELEAARKEIEQLRARAPEPTPPAEK